MYGSNTTHDDFYDGMAGLDSQLGFSLKKIVKNVGRSVSKAVKDTGKQLVRTGHQAGKIIDNKYVKGAVAAGLAVTGVGIPASAAIMGTMGAAGGALKKGGGLKEAVRRGYQGAATGAIAATGGKLVRAGASRILKRKAGTAPNPLETAPLPETRESPVSIAERAARVVRRGRGVIDKVTAAAGPAVGPVVDTGVPPWTETAVPMNPPSDAGAPSPLEPVTTEAPSIFKNPMALAGMGLLAFVVINSGTRRRR
jgi:hypothetical protein